MKKALFIILLITGLFVLSCNNNNSSSSVGKVGEIVVNPNGTTPLSAVYTTETVNVVPITVTVKGLYGEPDITHTYPVGYGTEFEIHGMFPESDNVIEVNDGGRIITKNVNVGIISHNSITIQKQYKPEINNLPEDKYINNPELYFMNISWGMLVGLSQNGYVRYVNLIKKYITKMYIDNSKILLYHGDHDSELYDLLANRIITFKVQCHHDMIRINNKHVGLSYSSWGSEDILVEMDNSGAKLRELSFGKLIQNSLDLKRYPEDEAIFKKIVFGEYVNNIYKDSSGNNKSIDWFHANSLVYDLSTDILYVSSRHRGVLAIDYSEWKLIWWMADETLSTSIIVGYGGIPYNVHLKDLRSLESYRVKGAGKDDGPKNQHALFLLANGNLGMFDNQGDEATNPNGSRYVEYKITGTHGNYTAQKVYEYINPTLYSRVMSDVDFTGDNHQNLFLVYSSPTARILELKKNTKKELFKLSFPFESYRADKMPLYYDEGRVYSEDCNLKNPN